VINAGPGDLDVAKFGAPLARFEGNTCDIAERFKSNYIIFNTNFCGGCEYPQNCSGGVSTNFYRGFERIP
jgi:hypothetical protein